jgi:transcriptional regulator with XRE-family HTH domain
MNDFESKIGQRIKALRLSKGLDQRTLAERAGLRRSYISLIENGKKTAAVPTFRLIADGLGVGVGELFEDTENFRSPKIAVTRNIEAQPAPQKTSVAYTFKTLCSEKRNKIMDVFIVRLDPKNKQRYDFAHRGEEFVYVLRGSLRLSYDGEIIILEEGDAVYFDASLPHRLELNGNKTAYVISVNSAGSKPQDWHEDHSTERPDDSDAQEDDL